MINKEEIEKYKIQVINKRKRNTEIINNSLTSLIEQEIRLETNNIINGALSIINRLENKQQIVIEKLEEKIEMLEDVLDLCNADGKIAKYKIEDLKEEISDLKEILEIMKGE